MLALVLKRTICSLMGVPANELTNAVMPPFTLVMLVEPMEPEVSTIMPKLPPQRERVAEKVGTSESTLVDRLGERVVPPAL